MFDPIINTPLAITISVLLLAGLCFLEIIRKGKRLRKVLRIMAICGLCFGLLCIILQPQISEKVKGKPVMYLTNSYDVNKIDSLKKAYKGIRIYSRSDVKSKYKKVASIQHLMTIDHEANPVLILGHGLKKEEQYSLPNCQFFPTRPIGIVDINFPKKIILGDRAEVQIETYLQDSSILYISGSDEIQDSTFLAPGQAEYFLRLLPKTTGYHTYRLFDKEGHISELLAIQVLDKPVMSVLMLNGYPNFESRYIKAWLAKEGHHITVRNKVSKSKYRYEYINTRPNPFRSFEVNQYDLALLDYASLQGMEKRQLDALEQAIRDGMGIYLFGDEQLRNISLLNSWFNLEPGDKPQLWIDGVVVDRLPWKFGEGRFLSSVLETDEILVQKRLLGEGRILLSVFSHTYPLLLQGHEQTYDRYWSKVVSSSINLQLPAIELVLDELLPRINQQLDFQLIADEIPEFKFAGEKLPLIRDVIQADIWHGRYWPSKPTWSNLSMGDDSLNFDKIYIYPDSSWQSVFGFRKLRGTKKIMMGKDNNSLVESLVTQAISPWAWYGLIIVSLALLWIEPKL